MITISGFLLLLTALYSGIRLIFFYLEYRSIYYLGLAVGVFALAGGVAGAELEAYLPYINGRIIMDWSRVISISFIMSSLAVLLWMSKPVFARFPFIFCSLPLLFILVFPFIVESSALRELILALFQGGAIAIGIMLYALKATRNPDSYYVMGGAFIFLITFLLHWVPIQIITMPVWAIQLFIATAILLITYGFAKLLESEKTEPAPLVNSYY